jgi:hypothetical protein
MHTQYLLQDIAKDNIEICIYNMYVSLFTRRTLEKSKQAVVQSLTLPAFPPWANVSVWASIGPYTP